MAERSGDRGQPNPPRTPFSGMPEAGAGRRRGRRPLACLLAFTAALAAGGQERPQAGAVAGREEAARDSSPAPVAPEPREVVAPDGARPDQAWALLEQTRKALAEAGPQLADFTQTYVPAGFSTGESESGRLAVALPNCLRWDYVDPFPKSFLICDEIVHSWNPGETSGRRAALDAESAAGLDLLLLSLERLLERYDARIGAEENGDQRVELVPRGDNGGFRDAALVIDRATTRPVSLSYSDPDGNLTRFELSDFRPLDEPGAFAPPEGLIWQEE